MNSSLKYIVQIITDAEHLTEALSLRYLIYSKAYPSITEKHKLPFESDCFDNRSIHLGLYCENNSNKELAGYCRLIFPEYFKNAHSEYLIEQHDFFPIENFESKNNRMGFFKYTPANYISNIDSFCENLEKEGRFYAETSRFIIDEACRSLSLSAFFTQSMFAIAASLRMEYNFFSANKHHAAFYQRNGLTLFKGLEPYSNPLFKTTDVIFGTNLNFPNLMQTSIKTLKQQLETENQITFFRRAA